MRSVFLICCLSLSFAYGQDIHFTQWTKNPLYVSPSFAGASEDRARFNFQRREQWASVSIPFNTTAMSVDIPLKKNGFGAQLVLDQAGSSRLSQTNFKLNYSREINNWRVGLYVGFANRSIDYTDLVFIDPGEQIESLNKNYLDVGFGFNRQLNLSFDKELQFGYSISHLNRPDQSFLSQPDIIPFTHHIFSVMEWELSNQLKFYPSLLLSVQDKQRQLNIGGEFSYDLNTIEKNIKLSMGSNYRYDDAIAFFIGAHYQQTFISFNYDFNVSDLSPATNNFGAWEILLTYTLKHLSVTRPNYQACPSFL